MAILITYFSSMEFTTRWQHELNITPAVAPKQVGQVQSRLGLKLIVYLTINAFSTSKDGLQIQFDPTQWTMGFFGNQQ